MSNETLIKLAEGVYVNARHVTVIEPYRNGSAVHIIEQPDPYHSPFSPATLAACFDTHDPALVEEED